MRSKVLTGFFLVICLAVAGTVTAGTANAQEEKYVWTFATNPGPAANTWVFHPLQRFQKLLEERSDGRLVLKTKVGLFPPTQVVHAVIKGQVEMGFERIPWLSGTFPLWDVSLPFFWDNIFEYESFINDPRMVAITKKTYGEKGLVKLADIPDEALDGVFATKEISKIEDFKGVKIRTAGVIPTLALQLMGAKPLTIGAAEILEALQRGTVDAIQTSRGFGMGMGLPDISSHLNLWRVQSVFPGMLVVNKKKFEALPADLQQILMDVSKQVQGEVVFGGKVEELESEIGVKVSPMKLVVPENSEIDKARKLVKPVVKRWLKIAGPHGQEVLDIAAEYAGGAEIMLDK